MSNYLFVYGTLMKNCTNGFSLLIQQNTTYIGSGYVYGTKYQLDKYPGIKLDPNNSEKTYGELYKITANQKLLFKSLDYYEGYISDDNAENLFVRKLVTVFFEEEKIEAWIYEYARAIDS